MSNNKKPATLFDIGLSCMALSLLNGAFSFITPIATFGFAWMGLSSITFHFIDKNKKFDKLWEGIGLKEDKDKPKLRSKIKTDYGYYYRFNVPVGKGISDFEKKHDAIYSYFDKEFSCNRLNIKYSKGGNMLFEMYQKGLGTEYLFDDNIATKGELEIPLGYSFGEKLVTIDLNKTKHILIAGETGGGKSTLIRLIITYLLVYKQVEMYLSDFKWGIEFKMFEKHPRVKEIVRNKEDAYSLLCEAYKEMQKRGNLFYEKDCKDVFVYNEKHPNQKLKYQIIVIDEMAQLSSKDYKDAHEIVESIVQMGRATGVYVILATQKPQISDNIITSQMKGNLTTIIGLKTTNKQNSIQIIDESGLEKLRGEGHAIIKHNGELKEIQTFNLTDEKAKTMLKNSNKSSNNPKNNRKNSKKHPKNYKNQCKFIKKEDISKKNQDKIKNINDFLRGDD